ncbi:hypothetical protein SLE2022_179910 [Rubroshorea leprosula]
MPPVPVQFSELGSSTLQSGEVKLSIGKKITNFVASWMSPQFSYLNLSILGLHLNQGEQPKGEFSSEEPFEIAVFLLGIIKSLLVGPPLSSFEKLPHSNEMHDEMLRATEINLSLLYELLHTKLPMVVSKIGYVCRIINLGCILGALLSFSLLKKNHYNLFDIWLTYGLLIGDLTLDLISIISLISGVGADTETSILARFRIPLQ